MPNSSNEKERTRFMKTAYPTADDSRCQSNRSSSRRPSENSARAAGRGGQPLPLRFFLHRVALQVFQRNEFERGDVAGREDDRRGPAGVKRLFPARDAKAPAVARLEARELVLGDWRGQIVADDPAEGEELGGRLDANGVESVVAGAGAAIAVAVETGHGREAAGEQFAPEDVGADRFGHKSSLPERADLSNPLPLL